MSKFKNTTGAKSFTIKKISKDESKQISDQLAIESPLLIQLKYPSVDIEDLVITMHTPVFTEDLVKGFLYTEGIIDDIQQIKKVELGTDNALVELNQAPIKKSERGAISTAACGMCGKTSLEAIDLLRTFDLDQYKAQISSQHLLKMDQQMRQEQLLFEQTGGIHAAALFDFEGQMLVLREDIGRHNAVDKAIGQMLERGLDRKQMILYVSGRAGFELVQKALVSGISMMVAVGAPSSLAVDYALNNGMTLIGFMQQNRFNIYAHSERVISPS